MSIGEIPMAQKIRMNVYLPDDMMTQLKSVSEKSGAPIAELIRRAVAQYLKTLKK
jgi:hypothetical protein